MLPSLQQEDSVMEHGRVTQRLAVESVDSSAGPSSTSTSTSTSPSSSISDASMTIEHAKETGFSSIIPQLKHEEPGDSMSSLRALSADVGHLGKPVDSADSQPSPSVTSPKIEKMEKLEISSPIPLSRLFDFDKEDHQSDQIVKNESERQYHQKLRDEFDAGFENMKDDAGSNGIRSGCRNGDHDTERTKMYDSDEDEEIRIDDDDDEDEDLGPQRTRSDRHKQPIPPPPPPPIGPPSIKHLPSALDDAQSTYQPIEYNIYRGVNTGNSPVDDCLPCQCKYNPHRDPRWKACGPDCINRNLLVECIEDDCPCGSYCLNRRFQTKQNAHVDVVKTERKGYGLRAMEGLSAGTFVMEYIGEVLPHSSFVKRTREYSLAGVEHFYFMSLQSDEVIDATKKGCLARFINHSCNPNCHLEKWVVGSKLRIGIFTIKHVGEGEELTFDYQFERYGAEAQKCYCGEPNCTGFIGGNKRSSATRLDNYHNLDEVEDEDEIDLENQMSLRHPKKDKGNDGDYEDEYEQRKITRGIEDPLLVEKLARIMFMKPKVEKSKRLLAKLMATTERVCLRRFLVLHGLVILKAWLKHYKDEPDIIEGIMFVLPNIPLLSRNAIEDSQIDEAVQEVADGPECASKGMAQDLLIQWKELKPSYRIPKAKKPTVAVSADVISTPLDEPSSFMSPAESNGSGSAEGLGKRQYEDEDRASTPAGMEKRGKFEGQVGPMPSDEADAPSVPSDASRYHNYAYDSPDYGPRAELHRAPDHYSRMGDGYGRDSRDPGYSRMDYPRHEPHSREGSYGRSGDPGYGRSESYGRHDPYSMSKASYERGRYEHYRSERDRYYDYYRERDYDRDYRRDMRDPRDLRDDRDRDYRDPRDYRETRDLYSHAPPSPRPKDRNLSPGAPVRRDRSPSTSTQPGSWRGDKSRSSSPSKEHRVSQPLEPIQAALDIIKSAVSGAQTTDALDSSKPASSIGNLPALLAEEAVVSAPLVATPDRADSTSLGPVNAPASGTPPSASQHVNDYHYRSGGGHGDYPHSRYSGHSGSYHHSSSSRYYRHSSSAYPHYSSSHHGYRGPSSSSSSSRAFASTSNYPPPPPASAELPPNWAKATDSEGRVYYYNEITRATQWDVPRIEAPVEVSTTPVSEVIPQAPAAHYSQQPHTYSHHHPHQTHQVAHTLAPRAVTPEPPKPVNIDGFTQEQLQEVIGRAYDKQKQKNLANGIGSAGASVHDVDSPTTRSNIMHSPSMVRSGKPLKPMTEKDLKAAVGASVVKNMTKYKMKLSADTFKKQARKITHLIAEKEMRSKSYKTGEMTEITAVVKNKIRRFVKEYMSKFIKKQAKELDRATSAAASSLSSTSTAALVNGTRNSVSHVIVLGADGVPLPSLSGFHTAGSAGLLPITVTTANATNSTSSAAAGSGAAAIGQKEFGDADAEDEDEVKYGEGEDGDEDDGDEDDDDAGVAAVPSSSVELPL
ncbi:histone methyltransferase set2 [Mortierella claussenii]|nr:histone methyltransferase set2 [Mortierella claussenii]